ncbi:MAG: acyltransferase 3 family protein [Chitinophagaceae bacterium]|nr:acyltransferase 3 family protein [Chitinophagaceae bacterium]
MQTDILLNSKQGGIQIPGTNHLLGRIKELDGLRGIAILLVVSFHYINNQLVDNNDKLSQLLAKITSYGWVGVDLFLVLSGFLIGNILIANKNSPNYFKTFYSRRIVRIIPNYFLLLIIFACIWNIPNFKNNYFLGDKSSIPLWSYFLMVHNFFMAYNDNLGNRALSVTWSIGIEEQFYLFFPFLVYHTNKRGLLFILISLVFTAIIIRSLFITWVPKYVLLPSRMDGLSLGFIVAYAYSENVLFKHKEIVARLASGILAILLLGCGYFYWRYNDLGLVKHTLFALIFSMLLIFALISNNSLYGKLLKSKILIWIGTISYSLYLFHYAILGIAYHIYGKTGIGIHSQKDIIITLCAFIAALGVSWLIYRLLEQPMVRIGKRWRY